RFESKESATSIAPRRGQRAPVVPGRGVLSQWASSTGLSQRACAPWPPRRSPRLAAVAPSPACRRSASGAAAGTRPWEASPGRRSRLQVSEERGLRRARVSGILLLVPPDHAVGRPPVLQPHLDFIPVRELRQPALPQPAVVVRLRGLPDAPHDRPTLPDARARR